MSLLDDYKRMVSQPTEDHLRKIIRTQSAEIVHLRADLAVAIEALEYILKNRTSMDGRSIAECRRKAVKALAAIKEQG